MEKIRKSLNMIRMLGNLLVSGIESLKWTRVGKWLCLLLNMMPDADNTNDAG